jgi:phosphatidate phosphatase LPIN
VLLTQERGLILDVMLDAYGYKATVEDTKQLDSLAREIFKEETGRENLDALIGHDQNGNLWIYASEEAKQYAESQSTTPGTPSSPSQQLTRPTLKALTQISSEEQQEGRISRAESEPAIPTVDKSKQDDGYSYAKTLRLTSEQLVYTARDALLIRNR